MHIHQVRHWQTCPIWIARKDHDSAKWSSSRIRCEVVDILRNRISKARIVLPLVDSQVALWDAPNTENQYRTLHRLMSCHLGLPAKSHGISNQVFFPSAFRLSSSVLYTSMLAPPSSSSALFPRMSAESGSLVDKRISWEAYTRGLLWPISYFRAAISLISRLPSATLSASQLSKVELISSMTCVMMRGQRFVVFAMFVDVSLRPSDGYICTQSRTYRFICKGSLIRSAPQLDTWFPAHFRCRYVILVGEA